MDWFCAIRSAKIVLMREMIPELTVEEVYTHNTERRHIVIYNNYHIKKYVEGDSNIPFLLLW